MAMDWYKLFNAGYNPPPWYVGYDESWILGATGPPWQTSCSNTGSQSTGSGGDKKPEKKPDGPLELYVPICCDRCVERIYRKLKMMEGVASVEISVAKKKVTVKGPAKPAAVLNMARKIKQSSEFWKDKYPPPKSDKSKKKEPED